MKFWLGLLFRLLWSFLLVFLTYSPSGNSYFHWVKDAYPQVTALMLFLGLGLALGWILYIKFTLQSLKIWGVIVLTIFLASFVWLLLDWDLIDADSPTSLTYIVMIVVSVILGVGMYWGHIQRKLSGQFAIGSSPDEIHHG